MIGGTFFIAERIDADAVAAAKASSDECARIVGDLNCASVWTDVYHASTTKIQYGLWGFSAIEAAIWLVIALVLFGTVFWSFRWVIAGRNKQSPEQRMGTDSSFVELAGIENRAHLKFRQMREQFPELTSTEILDKMFPD
jgi:hypothetical protein